MNKINNINSQVKKSSLKKKVPKTSETKIQQKIQSLFPNDLHNLESPKIYIEKRRYEANVRQENFELLFFEPWELQMRDNVFNGLINERNFELLEEYEVEYSQYKDYTNELLLKVFKYSKLTHEDFFKNPIIYKNLIGFATLLSTQIATKFSVHYGLYCSTLKALGTQKHQKLLKDGYNFVNLGCFMMTEIGHGSNVQGIVTNAHYFHEKRSFVLNTPHEIGMKFWIGNLGRTADYGVAFANLIVGEQNYGVHVFLVKLRDNKGNLYSGLEVGDCGHKIGLNGIDNGWIMFRGFEIPYDNLLDRYSQIDESGKFVSSIAKKSMRFATQLNALSSGRVNVAFISSVLMIKTIGNTLRYLCVRKQFGSAKYQEQTLIEYPLVQQKVFDRLAKVIITRHFTDYLFESIDQLEQDLKSNEVKELHALHSYVKCQSTYLSMEVILDMREVCGGHGYSAYSGFNILSDQNVQMTWEGTNDVLIQQTAKYLLTVMIQYFQKNKIVSKTFEFLKQLENEDMIQKEVEQIKDFILNIDSNNLDLQMLNFCLERMLQFQIKKQMDIVLQQFLEKSQTIKDQFQLFNMIYAMDLRKLSFLFGDYMVLVQFGKFLKSIKNENLISELQYLVKMMTLMRIRVCYDDFNLLEEYFSLDIKNKLHSLKFEIYPTVINDSIIFIDTFMPPDQLLNSTVGKSDGDIYNNIMSKVRSVGINIGKKNNWKDLNLIIDDLQESRKNNQF